MCGRLGALGRSATRYIKQAREVVKDDLKDLDRADMLRKDSDAGADRRCVAAQGRENNAIGAIRLMNELIGFGKE